MIIFTKKPDGTWEKSGEILPTERFYRIRRGRAGPRTKTAPVRHSRSGSGTPDRDGCRFLPRRTGIAPGRNDGQVFQEGPRGIEQAREEDFAARWGIGEGPAQTAEEGRFVCGLWKAESEQGFCELQSLPRVLRKLEAEGETLLRFFAGKRIGPVFVGGSIGPFHPSRLFLEHGSGGYTGRLWFVIAGYIFLGACVWFLLHRV